MLINILDRYRTTVACILCAALILAGTGFVVAEMYYYRLRSLTDAEVLVTEASCVLIDNPARGVLPRIIHHLPDDTIVLVASQKDLIDEKEKWLDRDDGILFISQISYSGTEKGREKLFKIAATKYDIKPLSYQLWGFNRRFRNVGDVYFFNPKTGNDRLD